MLADVLDTQSSLLAIGVGVAILFVIAGIALWFYRAYERWARRSLERRFADLNLRARPLPGDIVLTYHTYHGFLAWHTEEEHQTAGPPDDIRKLLRRLLRFNLLWGLMTGTLFVLPLAIINYFAQRRSIVRQMASGGSSGLANDDAMLVAQKGHAAPTTSAELTRRRSTFHRVVGWLAAGLCGVFGITAIVMFTRGEVEPAFGGVLISGLLGWVARDWLGKGA